MYNKYKDFLCNAEDVIEIGEQPFVNISIHGTRKMDNVPFLLLLQSYEITQKEGTFMGLMSITTSIGLN